MRFLKLIFLAAVLLAIVGGAAGWFLAGREPGPTITIGSPQKYVGRSTALAATVESDTPVTAPEIIIEQGGQSMPVTPTNMDWTGIGRVAVSGTVGKSSQPALANGPARLTVTARRDVFFGMRQTSPRGTQDVEVRLDPPRVAVVSTHQFINLGGAEFVILRATPEDVDAGVIVGDARYPSIQARRSASPIRRCGSDSLRFATIRTSARASPPTRAMRPATRPRARSSISPSSRNSCSRASRSISRFSTAWSPPSPRIRPI